MEDLCGQFEGGNKCIFLQGGKTFQQKGKVGADAQLVKKHTFCVFQMILLQLGKGTSWETDIEYAYNIHDISLKCHDVASYY